MERDVLPGEVGHGRGRLRRNPPVVVAAVEGKVTSGPAVIQVLQESQTQLFLAGVEGQHFAEEFGLVPDALAVRQGCRSGVAETAYAAQRAEVVVEGAVLLHEDDDMLDVAQRTGAVIGRYRRCLVDGAHQGGRGGGSAGELKESAAVKGSHDQ